MNCPDCVDVPTLGAPNPKRAVAIARGIAGRVSALAIAELAVSAGIDPEGVREQLRAGAELDGFELFAERITAALLPWWREIAAESPGTPLTSDDWRLVARVLLAGVCAILERQRKAQLEQPAAAELLYSASSRGQA